MKKLLLGMMGAFMLGATSCDDIKKDNPDNSSTIRGTLPACVIFEKAEKPVALCPDASINFTYFFNRGIWNVTINDLDVAGMDSELSFTTPDIIPSGQSNQLLSYLSAFTAKSGQTVSGFSCILSNNYYYYTGEETTTLSPLGTLITVTFNVPGQYQVRAFPPRCYFGGTTVSTYKDAQGNDKRYESTSAQFGLDMDVAARKATVTIHNAKFAEEMPGSLTRMELKGLTIEGDREHGYKLVGKDIIPVVGEGAAAVPYKQFVFNEIEFHPTNNLMTLGECEFTVAGRYHGKFTGSFVK